MTTCRRCGTEWRGLLIAHCSECHETFTSVAAFDRHRSGQRDVRPQGECYDPASSGLERNDRGQWTKPISPASLEQLRKSWGRSNHRDGAFRSPASSPEGGNGHP